MIHNAIDYYLLSHQYILIDTKNTNIKDYDYTGFIYFIMNYFIENPKLIQKFVENSVNNKSSYRYIILRYYIKNEIFIDLVYHINSFILNEPISVSYPYASFYFSLYNYDNNNEIADIWGAIEVNSKALIYLVYNLEKPEIIDLKINVGDYIQKYTPPTPILHISGSTTMKTGNLSYKVNNSSKTITASNKLFSTDISIIPTSCYQMFNSPNYKTINLSLFDFSNVTTMEYMFYICRNLTDITFGNNCDTHKVTNMRGMFRYCNNIETIDISMLLFDNVTTMQYMFNNYYTYNDLPSKLKNIIFPKSYTPKLTNMLQVFWDNQIIENVDLRYFSTSNVTNMQGLFQGCTSLKNVLIDPDHWNTSKVTDMSHMFQACFNFDDISIFEHFDTSKVTDMLYMFFDCLKLKLNYIPFDTSNVTNMSYFMCSMGRLAGQNFTTLDLSNLNTSNVTTLYLAFARFYVVTNIILGPNCITPKCTDFTTVFAACGYLASIDISTFDFSKATTVYHMFGWDGRLITIKFGVANFIKCTNFEGFFRGCDSLTTIEGELTNIKYDFAIHEGPMLNTTSLQKIVDALSSIDTTQVFTVTTTQYNQIGTANIAIITSKAWTITIDDSYVRVVTSNNY